MNSGYFNAVAGLHAADLQQEIVANNLANSSTAGFKGSRPFIEALDHELMRSPGQQPHVSGRALDFSAGPLQLTGRPLDVSFSPDAVLAVETELGERYTRDGRLTLDGEGKLVTMTGLEVAGDAGPIQIGKGIPSIGGDGSVLVDGVKVGQLRLMQVEDPNALISEGGLYAAKEPLQQMDDPVVTPGTFESANVDPIRGTVTMIEALRRFEAIQGVGKQLMGELTRQLIEESGRPIR